MSKEKRTVELQQFVTEALMAVIDGIADAQSNLNAVGHKGAIINPAGAYVNSDRIRVVLPSNKTDNTLPVQMMSFDIAVWSEKSGNYGTNGEGGVNIRVVSSRIGTGYSKEEIEGLVSRIKFEVPVVFPRDQLRGQNGYD